MNWTFRTLLTLAFIAIFAMPVLETRAEVDPAKLKRLSPHGEETLDLKNTSIKTRSECQVCHFLEKGKLRTLPSVGEQCMLCHNHYPHAGIYEHFKKNAALKNKNIKEIIDCLSCHRPHRAILKKNGKAPKEETSKPSFLFSQTQNEHSKDIDFTRSKTPMLSRSCKDCHSWESLP